MFGVIKSVSHRKLLGQHENWSLDLNVFIISNVQLFLRVGEDTEAWHTYTLQETEDSLRPFLEQSWNLRNQTGDHRVYIFYTIFGS